MTNKDSEIGRKNQYIMPDKFLTLTANNLKSNNPNYYSITNDKILRHKFNKEVNID